MSRIGRKSIAVPDGVDVAIAGRVVTVKGKNGEMTLEHHPAVTVAFDADAKEISVENPGELRENRKFHGLTRSLINNMVLGVTTYFEKKLDIVGVGYQATIDGTKLCLQVGFANTVELPIPENVICELPSNIQIALKSADKQAVGQFAAEIRRVRPPEPYKGKGIRYQNEQIRRKAGKALASS